MLSSQLKLSLSYYSDLYDMIVPKDHILRKIRELVDFSFIYDELKNKYCLDNGRNAKNPILLFKYLLLKYLYNLSDNGVVERSRCSVIFIMYTAWFLCSIVKCYIQNVNEVWERYQTSDTGAQE